MRLCPTCNKKFIPEQHTVKTPFCSERCRLIDLGAWLSEKHRIQSDNVDISNDAEKDEQTKH